MSSLGLVVAGGAARGAWQSGVLRFIFTDLAKQLGHEPWPAVVSGTSVGALNGVNVAARNVQGILELSELWRTMTIERIYRVRPSNLVSSVYNSLWSAGPFAVLDAHPLNELVRAVYPEQALREAIAFGDTRAFIVSATELDSGVNTLFVDSHDPTLWLKPGPGTKVRRGHITAEHCLASAALPLLFEPVEVDGKLHVDGMLRQNTPVRPVIQTGCRRILVVGVDRPGQHASVEGHVVPTFAFVAGKALNAVLLDPVDRDIQQVERLNELIRWGRARYGPDFEMAIARDLDTTEIQIHRVSPSEDLGAIAREVYQAGPLHASAPARAMLSVLGDPANVGESDLLSYLLFDHRFTATIEQLGFEDARRDQERLARFLAPGATP